MTTYDERLSALTFHEFGLVEIPLRRPWCCFSFTVLSQQPPGPQLCVSVWPLSRGGDHRCGPRLKHHAKAIFRVQGHHDLRLDASLGQQQIIAAADKRQEQRPSDRREMEAHAGARAGTKRQIGGTVGVHRPATIPAETVRGRPKSLDVGADCRY